MRNHFYFISAYYYKHIFLIHKIKDEEEEKTKREGGGRRRRSVSRHVYILKLLFTCLVVSRVELRFDLESVENCCYYSSTFNFLLLLLLPTSSPSSPSLSSVVLIICVTMKSWSHRRWRRKLIAKCVISHFTTIL